MNRAMSWLDVIYEAKNNECTVTLTTLGSANGTNTVGVDEF